MENKGNSLKGRTTSLHCLLSGETHGVMKYEVTHRWRTQHYVYGSRWTPTCRWD